MAVTDDDDQGGSGLSYDDDSAHWAKFRQQADMMSCDIPDTQ